MLRMYLQILLWDEGVSVGSVTFVIGKMIIIDDTKMCQRLILKFEEEMRE